MSDNLTAVMLSSGNHIIEALCALTFVIVPLWLILHYVARFRASRTMNAAEARAFDRLVQSAARMESRIIVLERVLDREVPDWRYKNDFGVSDHETV